eukprot:5594739-Prymnesium_polylepis.1
MSAIGAAAGGAGGRRSSVSAQGGAGRKQSVSAMRSRVCRQGLSCPDGECIQSFRVENGRSVNAAASGRAS